MYSYYFIIIVGILALLLNQSNAFTLSSSSTPTTNQSYKYITSRRTSIQSSSTATTTRLSMTQTSTSSSSSSSVSRRGFLESVAVSCGSLVQQSLVVDMTADQVKDEGIHDMLELLAGDSDDDNREFSSCLSDAISDMNHYNVEEEVERYLPLAEQLVEQCISRRSGMHR